MNAYAPLLAALVALLAGLTKGPNYFNPDRHPGRAQERLAYVLSRMREDAATGTGANEPGSREPPPLPKLVAYERPRRDIGYHFVDQVAREAKTLAGIVSFRASAVSAEAPICIALNPWWATRSGPAGCACRSTRPDNGGPSRPTPHDA